VYRWQGKLDSADVCLLIIKTARSREKEVEDTVRQLHSYSLPEHVALAIDDGNEAYLQWIEECVS
jgi:periplasmic divalent cation tolerance protein